MEQIVGLVLLILGVAIWITDIYLSEKLKSYLTPKDGYENVPDDESSDDDDLF